MLVHSRNLLLFLALAGAALFTWGLARRAELPTEPPVADASPTQRGYYMLEAELFATDDSGMPHYRIQAERLELESRDDDFRLEGVRVEYSPESETAWGLTAARGILSNDQSDIDLSEVTLARTPRDGASPFEVETSWLRLDMRSKLVTTDQAVTLRNERSETVAQGLTINLETETYELPNATTHYVR